MFNVLEMPAKYISKVKETPINVELKFARAVSTGRIISAYSGFLPNIEYTAKHILKCEHLRDIPGEKPCYRAHQSLTHQIWIWYRINQEPDKLYLLFRSQFDFTIAGLEPDWVAEQISEYLAELLLNCEPHSREVFRHQDGDTFWTLAVERKLKSLIVR